jgi:hypothetical protein
MATIRSPLPFLPTGILHKGSVSLSHPPINRRNSSITDPFELKAEFADSPSSCPAFSVSPQILAPDGPTISNTLVSPNRHSMMAQSKPSLQAPPSNRVFHNALLQIDCEDDSEKRSFALRHAARQVMDAEDRVSGRRREVMSALRQSTRFCHETEFTAHRSYYRAHGRLAVARAAREALLAERRLAAKRIREAKLRLRASYDAAETVRTRLKLADRYLVTTITEMSTVGWMTMTPAIGPSNPSPPWPEDPWSSDSESEDFTVGSDDEDTNVSVDKPEGGD